MGKTRVFLTAALLSLTVLGACNKNDKGEPEVIYGDQRLDSLAAIRYKVRDVNNQFVTLETSTGSMTLELYRDVAPNHADSFAVRASEGFYSQTFFHRVVKNFMIQGGFVQLTGRDGVEYFLPDEFSTLQHREGTLSMASSGSPNSAQAQFFICLSRNRSTQYLDGRYSVFGHLIKGYDVLHQIGEVKVKKSQVMGGEESEPIERIDLIKAYLSDAEGNPLRE